MKDRPLFEPSAAGPKMAAKGFCSHPPPPPKFHVENFRCLRAFRSDTARDE